MLMLTQPRLPQAVLRKAVTGLLASLLPLEPISRAAAELAAEPVTLQESTVATEAIAVILERAAAAAAVQARLEYALPGTAVPVRQDFYM